LDVPSHILRAAAQSIADDNLKAAEAFRLALERAG
jgi:hypothetical protein